MTRTATTSSPQKRLLAGIARRLRHTSLAEWATSSFGPSRMKVPRSLRRRAVRQHGLPSRADGDALLVKGPATVQLAAEVDASVRASLHPLWRRPQTLPPAWVAKFRDAHLVGRHAVPVLRTGDMLLTPFRDELSLLGAEPNAGVAEWFAQAAAGTAPCAHSLDSPLCSFVARLDSNYFHWLVDICTQLEALEAYHQVTGERPHILIRHDAPLFATSLITWPASWSGADLPSDRPLARRVPRLIVSAWRNSRHAVSPAAVQWLRERLLESYPASANPTKKLYIDRRAGWRPVGNAPEIASLMESLGFDVVHPETMSIIDQMRVFGEAKAVIGVHGAALANILFAPKARLVELKGRYGADEYAALSAALGNSFRRVHCGERQGALHADPRALTMAANWATSVN
jgi:hypothetical protein